MILRLCLKDKSSVLVDSSFVAINEQATKGQFIEVKNVNSQKYEIYNKDYIWCVRIHSDD